MGGVDGLADLGRGRLVSTPASPLTQPTAGQRALILGGGGSTGHAWLIGMVAGLFEQGVDVTTADLIVGTSAGSTAAAHLVGASPADLLAATLDEPAPPQGTRPPQATEHLERIRAIAAAAHDAADYRRRMGAVALEMLQASDGTWQDRWRAIVAARLQGRDWPDQHVLLTAVDAETGEPVALDRSSGVDLVDGVAASCAGGLPYRIGDRWYIDGGYRTNAENADLASGYARVLVLSPLGGRTLTSAEWATDMRTQVDQLRAEGSRVETIVPDTTSEHLFGGNAMNLALRPDAARAGSAQGAALAERVAELWH